jgi:hypothetical protein
VILDTDNVIPPNLPVQHKPPVILILTAYKKFKYYEDSEGSIINIVYRDGMVYLLSIIGAWKLLAFEVLSCNWSREGITVSNVIVGAVFPVRMHVVKLH